MLNDEKILRGAKISLLNNFALEHLAMLYNRTDDDQKESDEEGKSSVVNLVHKFLMKACTVPGKGICFRDDGYIAGF